MGLDTSHDAWHGPYSSFNEFRVAIHAALGGAPTTQDLSDAWEAGRYNDQSVPINVLMNHSDCDGEIAAKDCGPLADAMEALLPKLSNAPDEYLSVRSKAKRFIVGLRDAAEANEPVDFH